MSQEENTIWTDPPVEPPTMEEWTGMAQSGEPLDQAVAELWRGRASVSSVTAARLSRAQADALLVELVDLAVSETTVRKINSAIQEWVSEHGVSVEPGLLKLLSDLDWAVRVV